MTSCSRCSQIFDETKRQTCPNCFAPLAQNPNPAGNYGASAPVPPPGASSGAPVPPPLPAVNVRVSLTGEVFETPAPAPPVYPPPAAYPPTAPQNYSAPPLSSSVPKAEQNWLIAIGVMVSAVILLAIGFAVVKARQYKTGAAAFERESHIDLSTPQATAKGALTCVKEQTWARFYLLTHFQGPDIKAFEQSEAFAKSVRGGLDSNPAGRDAFMAKYSGMTDIDAGTPQINGQTADVPVTAMLHYGGKDVPLKGIAHLINDDEGKWRLNLTTVSPACNTPQDQAAIAKVLTDLLGLQTAPSVPAGSSGAAPASAPTQPMYTYPPGFGPDINNPMFRQRFRGRQPRYPYPPNMPQPGTPAPPQNPQPGTPAPSNPNPAPSNPTPSNPNPAPAPSQPAPTNPSGPAPSDPKPSDPNGPNPNPATPPAAPNGGNGGGN